jgi:hypothetical protein
VPRLSRDRQVSLAMPREELLSRLLDGRVVLGQSSFSMCAAMSGTRRGREDVLAHFRIPGARQRHRRLQPDGRPLKPARMSSRSGDLIERPCPFKQGRTMLIQTHLGFRSASQGLTSSC